MATAAKKLTYADYEKIPADGFRHEIIEGEEFRTPSPEVSHQRVSRKLERILDEHVTKNRLGEVFDAPIDVVFSKEDVVQPDIIFISGSPRRTRVYKEGQSFESALFPDLTIRLADVF